MSCCYFAGTMGPLSSSRNLMLSLTIVLSTCATLLVSGQRASTCDSRACQLPNCFCGGINIPGNLTKEEIPQLVLLTFDDAVNGLNKEFFSKLFDERYNPNGCPIKVSSQWLCQCKLFALRMESQGLCCFISFSPLFYFFRPDNLKLAISYYIT